MSSLSPGRAVRYATGGSAARRSSADRTAAIVWLVLAIVGVHVLRDRALPDAGQVGAIALGSIVVILAGTIAPDLVFWSLFALFIAALLIDVPYLTPAIDSASGAINRLNPFGG